MYNVEFHTKTGIMSVGTLESLKSAIKFIQKWPLSPVVLSKNSIGYWVTVDNENIATLLPSRFAIFLREVPL